MEYKKTFSTHIINALIGFVLLSMAVICLLPLLNIIALSFSGKSAAAAGLVTFWPVDFSTLSYDYLMKDSKFFQAFSISVQRVILGGALNLILTVLMAYPLSRNKKEFKPRDVYMWILIFAMLFNGGLIPWYLVVRATGVTNSMLALILPRAVPIFNVILLMNFFRNIPKEINEAARIDGAGPLTILSKIYVPLSMAAIATVTLFSIVFYWNDFFDGLILINSQNRIPLQTYIQQLIVVPSALTQMDMSGQDIAEKLSMRTFNAAKVVVTTIPILLVYPFLQKYFVTGITLGSVKE
jgi:putative aldouronate transport system permease protein